jgi:hypothetical protein
MLQHAPTLAGAIVFRVCLTCSLALAQPAGQAQQWSNLKNVDDRSRIAVVPRDEVICFALYTVQDGVMKMSAQLYPLQDHEPHEVTLELFRNGQWVEAAQSKAHPVGWTATFRLPNWNATQDVQYRLSHPLGASYEGLIRRDPIDKTTIVAAAFTGNSPGPGGGKISKADVVESVRKIDPDVLLFTGDQVYDHTTHTAAWLKFGEDFGDIIKDRPTVTIPDDHDVGQGNLWGGGGRKVDIDTKGGYTRPANYVKMVERQQTSHLPDPVDPNPIDQGIGVYFTHLNVGGIDFAIVEDRKFKSGCFDFDIKGKGLGPRPDHIAKPDYDAKAFDVAGKKLLGDRQLKFLDQWARQWDGVVMKSLVSQTVFSMTSTFHSKDKTFYYADFDANGWPQTGRNRAIHAMRQCFAFHICGDQHLATIGQYGVDDWRDAGWWFCVPSIANLWPRWWQPRNQTGRNAEEGAQENTGDFVDGFGNKMTIYAHTNPRPSQREPVQLHERMPGFGIVRFHKDTRDITMECWPRMVDVTDPTQQYTGWPRTINQFDNLGAKTEALLPQLRIVGRSDPVIQVESEGELVYCVRIKGNSFQPKVPKTGKYSVTISDGKRQQTLSDVVTVSDDSTKVIEVQLGN